MLCEVLNNFLEKGILTDLTFVYQLQLFPNVDSLQHILSLCNNFILLCRKTFNLT